MKKVTLFFALAAIVGVGSAFATVSKSVDSGEYVKIGSNYVLKSSRPNTESCHSNGVTCDYTIIDPEGSLTDPDNFEPNQPGRWGL